MSDAASIGGGVLGIGLQQIGQQQQMSNQMQLMDMQQYNQMALNEQMQGIQQQNWDYTNYENQVKHAENAGLNVGLLYGQGGGGGSTMGGASGGNAASGAAPQNNMGMALQNSTLASQIKMNEAAADKAGAEADNIRAKTPNIPLEGENLKADTGYKTAQAETENQKRDVLIENMKQSGISQMLENTGKAWLMSDPDVRKDAGNYNETYDYHTNVGENSNMAKQIDAGLLKTASETDSNLAGIDLTNQKIKGYWTELLNETKKANAAGIQAAAQKLTSEWNTGEYTNWKTWADQAQRSVQAAGTLIKGGTKINKTNTYNQNGDRWNDTPTN